MKLRHAVTIGVLALLLADIAAAGEAGYPLSDEAAAQALPGPARPSTEAIPGAGSPIARIEAKIEMLAHERAHAFSSEALERAFEIMDARRVQRTGSVLSDAPAPSILVQ